MMAAEGAIYPVHQLMADNGKPFDPDAFLPAVVGYYTDPQGNMLSFPFNSSTPIIYYNKDVFEAAGLDPEQAPATWADVEAAARRSSNPAPRPAASPPPGRAGCSSRTAGAARHAARHAAERLRRLRHRAGVQHPARRATGTT
jgi:ABC-type glycerol-3-phosphate transport system substrate-binding protein